VLHSPIRKIYVPNRGKKQKEERTPHPPQTVKVEKTRTAKISKKSNAAGPSMTRGKKERDHKADLPSDVEIQTGSGNDGGAGLWVGERRCLRGRKKTAARRKGASATRNRKKKLVWP